MKELEKILKEIEQKIEIAKEIIVDCPCDKLDETANDTAEAFIEAYKECQDIIRKYMTDGWIPVEDERLWDILFEEACVEGEQAKRIYNRLKETFGGERSEMDGKF